jgi:selenocysteine lyase/cysteine desulfurase
LNLFDVHGERYAFQQVEEMANKKMISFRTGCFCNPGIDELNNCISPDQLRSFFTSRDHGDYYDFIKFTNKMRGAVRISLGIGTTRADIEALGEFLKTFLNKPVHACNSQPSTPSTNAFFHKLFRHFKFDTAPI